MTKGEQNTEELRKAFYELTESVCDLMSKLLESKEVEVPYRQIRIYERSVGSSGLSLSFRREPSCSMLVSESMEKIRELVTHSKCISLVESHPIICGHVNNRVEVSGHSLTMRSERILSRFLDRFFEEHNGLSIDNPIFNQTFNDMLSFFTSDTVQIEVYVPIDNLTSELDMVMLDDDWLLERIPDERIGSMIIDDFGLGFDGPRYDIMKTQFALKRVVDVQKYVYQSDKRPDIPIIPFAFVGHIITALRILKEGTFLFRATQLRNLDWYFKSDPRISGYSASHTSTFGLGLEYKLISGEIDLLRQLILQFKDIVKPFTGETESHFLGVAIRRLNYGLERTEPQDRLIDFMIALESLFLREEGELSYRLSLRVGYFLEQDGDERETLVKILKAAYNARSKIVHGAKRDGIGKSLKKIGLTLRGLTKRIEETLRAAIKRIAELEYQDRDKLLESIDLQIVKGNNSHLN